MQIKGEQAWQDLVENDIHTWNLFRIPFMFTLVIVTGTGWALMFLCICIDLDTQFHLSAQALTPISFVSNWFKFADLFVKC